MRVGAVDTDARVLIVAEIGNNHEGDVGAALQMVSAAAKTGADAVKFQTIVPERLVSSNQEARLAQLRRYCLKRGDHEALAAHAVGLGLLFLSTPFDIESVAWLDALVPAFKIASGDNDFLALHDRIAVTGKPVMISLGFGGEPHAQSILDRFRETWCRYEIDDPGLALLHCVSSYPTPEDHAHLGAIARLARLGVTVGYSDHTLGPKASELAVAAGARIVEKHFTLDKARSTFRDHSLSADPAEMLALVGAVRRVERMLGTEAQAGADGGDSSARRSIAAARHLPPGTIITGVDLAWLRPGTGLRPGEEHRVIGRRVRVSIPAGQLIQVDQLDVLVEH